VLTVAPAGAGTSAGFAGPKIPCTAPGTPYSYGPPTTVGTWSKLKTGGGEDTCHSSVSARHGFATRAAAAPRGDHVVAKISVLRPEQNDAIEMTGSSRELVGVVGDAPRHALDADDVHRAERQR
jgi:hypothetical protein